MFKPHQTLHQRLVHVKDKPPREKTRNVVYGVTCDQSECTERYVGETQQTLKARMNQHRRQNPLSGLQESAVFSHLKVTGHTFSTDKVTILDKESNWHNRGVKEAIWERRENPSLNKKGGLRFNLSHIWDKPLKTIPSKLSRDRNHVTTGRQLTFPAKRRPVNNLDSVSI